STPDGARARSSSRRSKAATRCSAWTTTGRESPRPTSSASSAVSSAARRRPAPARDWVFPSRTVSRALTEGGSRSRARLSAGAARLFAFRPSDNFRSLSELLAGKYEVLERIREGGMGAIYRARHVHLGTDCVVKLMHARLQTDPGARERFRR